MAGEAVGISGTYIQMAEEVLNKKPDVEEQIMSGETTVKKENRKIKLEEQEKEIKKLIPEKEIKGVFDIIVIDPPWNYEKNKKTTYDSEGRRVASPYPEMSQTELEKIKIPVANNGILFLWTTHKFIWDAKELLDKWGFNYKGIVVWDKEKMGIGATLRMQCEFCLIGFKGKPLWKHKDIRDIIRETRTEHSKKPESFYKLVEKICIGRKLDYFARQKREGWDVYGDEVILKK